MPARTMEKLTVGERMSADVFTLQEDAKLQDAILLLRQYHIRHIPILSSDRIVGIISDRDVKKATPSVLSGVDREQFYQVIKTTPLSQVASKPAVTISPQATITEAVRTMVRKQVGCLPVVEAGKLLGIITQADMMILFLEELEGNLPA